MPLLLLHSDVRLQFAARRGLDELPFRSVRLDRVRGYVVTHAVMACKPRVIAAEIKKECSHDVIKERLVSKPHIAGKTLKLFNISNGTIRE